MLAKTGLVRKEYVQALLRVISELERTDFHELKARATPRGVYLMYEDYLRETLGDDIGGSLHTGRSRNDLNATVMKRHLRYPYLKLMGQALKLMATLTCYARRHRAVLMPYYTHGQAAVPGTYGHYLAGHALSLAGHLEVLADWVRELDVSPLGAGAVGGSEIEIDTQLTAQLLGFERGPDHSIEVVASRDYVLRLLATLVILGVSMSRLAEDMMQWCTAEFGFLSLPDQLVGSSSAMPQKRNPFLLEHVKGRCASALGHFVSAATAMHSTPFTNSIAVNSEGANHVWEALEQVTEAIVLLRIMVRGARPEPESMKASAEKGYTSALALANGLVKFGGKDFRTAHRLAGEVVNRAAETGVTLEEASADIFADRNETAAYLNPGSVALRCEWGGGAGPDSLASCVSLLRVNFGKFSRLVRRRRESWKAADAALEAAVSRLHISMDKKKMSQNRRIKNDEE